MTPPEAPLCIKGWKGLVEAERIIISEQRKEDLKLVGEALDAAPIGLALSGGGIRSAAVCLGAIQSLYDSKWLPAFDYLSTVSGGGYAGACLSAAQSTEGGGRYPFGDDVADSPVVSHWRNYSNFLMPRCRSAVQNWIEAATIILRGLLANALCVLPFLCALVLLAIIAFPHPAMLAEGNWLLRLPRQFLSLGEGIPVGAGRVMSFAHGGGLLVPLVLAGALATTLVAWAIVKQFKHSDGVANDGKSPFVRLAYAFALATLIALLIDLQPLLLAKFLALELPSLSASLAAAGAALAAVANFAGMLSRFVEKSTRSARWRDLILRIAARAVLLVMSLVLPLVLWLLWARLYAAGIGGTPFVVQWGLDVTPSISFEWIALLWAVGSILIWAMRSNAYSLHWFYRDRLATAFLVGTEKDKPDALKHLRGHCLTDLDRRPYHLVNTALNVQGSAEANSRGRQADFFLFSRDWCGSDLTGYVRTDLVQKRDPRLDLAAVMSISGAAVSANMGRETVRSLSPTMSLLNFRLGYYLANPKYFEEDPNKNYFARVWRRLKARAFLLGEMFNRLDETSHHVYLTDGGHIENLGIYELLRRKCRLIVAIDAEADPHFGFPSLLRMEQFARIDLGARITLPWEKIRDQSADFRTNPRETLSRNGPHAALGRINYNDESTGLLLYLKASLSGDEKDYILDYARRHPDFPHESTGDQFFSEEQFEMYRALGYHMAKGVKTSDRIAIVIDPDPKVGFADEAAARAALQAIFDSALPPPAQQPPAKAAGPAKGRSKKG